jgi:predicted AlkP superfamily pyrophosphatase or phosphodiesterase
VDFDLLFLYLGWPDECGHKEGWMSRPYLDAVENADACVGRLLAELSERDGRETVSLIVSDHGGHARTHGTEHDDDMLIPWILHGPGVRTGIELTGEIRIYDTCVTLASLMGLPQSPAWEGRVVDEALS